MRIAITGGREFKDQGVFDDAMEALQPTEMHFGDARGADAMAKAFALKHGIGYREYKASWAVVGILAGLLRNIRMLETAKPEMLAAFPGGAGTEHCVRNAILRGIPVRRFK